jgi:OmpA-OmpF porin, OOP family
LEHDVIPRIFKIFALLLTVGLSPAWSQSTPDSGSAPVVVSGTVPDEATRSAILNRVKELYAPKAVVDQLSVGTVVAPPNWGSHVQQMLTPALKQVARGQLSVSGSTVDLTGEVASDAVRQQLANDLARPLPQNFALRSSLSLSAATPQGTLDATLANRIIEFEPGSATLRPSGQLILDEMAAALLKINDKPIELIGHTDAQGARVKNIELSLARAAAVRTYLIGKGVSGARLKALGAGPDKPLATNDTAQGRARNRRIEFRLG